MSLPLAAVIKSLEKAPDSIVPVLSTLHYENSHLTSASKVDLKHLTSRTLNLCKSNDNYSVWCGINIVNILIDNPSILSSEGGLFFSHLLKILSSPRANDRRVFVSTVECLNKLCGNIRGKPTLTREILTPNLGSLFAVYLEKLHYDPTLVSASLKTLIQHHPTTSRPYANKLKVKLLEFISKEEFLSFPQKLKTAITFTLATLPVIEKEGVDQHWSRDVERIMCNIANTLELYSNFLNIKDDEELSKLLNKSSRTSEEEIFPPLHLDINSPSTLLQISNRVQLLFELLRGFIVCPTSFTVNVPIGKLFAIIDLACSINTKYIPFKREIRDPAVKEYVNVALLRGFESAIQLLLALPEKYAGACISHYGTVFSTLELMIFLKGRSLDKEWVFSNEGFVHEVILCTNNYLSLVTYYQDNSSIARVVEAALILVGPRGTAAQAPVGQTSGHSKSAKKRAKKGGAGSLADLLTHEHLFATKASEKARKLVLEFFTTVINRATLSPTLYNKLLKYILVEAVKCKDASLDNTIPSELEQILVAAVLNPAPESPSVLPIVSSLIWNSGVLGVFNNPRFPPQPLVVKNVDHSEWDDEDEDEEEAEKPIVKKPRSDAEIPFEAQPERSPAAFQGSTTGDINAANIFVKRENPVTATIAVENDLVEEKDIAEEETVPKVEGEEPEQMEDSDSEGSEIEIPDLDLEESEDEDA